MNPQDVLNELYERIDTANEVLIEMKSGLHIVRSLEVEIIMERPATMGGQMTGNLCRSCGGETVRTGTCETCLNCGESSGGC